MSRKALGLVSSRRFCIASSAMKTSLASSYTKLSTAPAVADQPIVLRSRLVISRVPSSVGADTRVGQLGSTRSERPAGVVGAAQEKRVWQRVRACRRVGQLGRECVGISGRGERSQHDRRRGWHKRPPRSRRFASGAHLGVEQLGPRVEPDRGRLLAVGTERRDDLGRVRVEVVRHVGERNLGRVEILEGDVHLAERRFELVRLVVEDAGLVGVEGEALARGELILQLLLALPAAILDCEADVGRVGAGGVGEDSGGRVADGAAKLLRLLDGVLAHKVHLERLVELGHQLDGAVEQVHLVDEEVAEDARAGDDHVDARSAELLEGDGLDLVDAAQGVRHRPDAHHPEHLRERLAVRLDVVGAPQNKGNRLGVGAVVVLHLALEQAVDDNLGANARGRSGDGLRIERVHVLARGQHEWVADRVAAGARRDELGVEALQQGAHLVVGHDLLEAKLEVAERLLDVGVHQVLEALLMERLQHRRAAEHVGQAGEHRVHRAHAARGVSGALHRGADGGTDRLHNLLAEHAILEVARIRAAVDVLNVAANGLGDDAGQAHNLVLGAVDRGDVDQGGDGLLGGGWHADCVKAARQQARLDLHNLGVDLADDGVAALEVQAGAVLVLGGQDNVLVQVARTGSGHNGVDDGGAAAGVAQALVRADQLAKLLETLVQAGVLGRRGQIRDGVGVRAALGDGGLGRVVGRVVVQAVRVARAGHADLLAGHELEGAVSAKVEHGVGAEDLLDVRVVSGEAVVRRGRLGVQQAHRVALIAKRGLHANEDVAKRHAEDEQVLAVGVEVAGRRAPVLLEVLGVRGELLVLGDRHCVRHVEGGRGQRRLLVVQDAVHEVLNRCGHLAHVVAGLLHRLETLKDGAEDVEVGGGAHVALVRGEGEDSDGHLLLDVGLLAEAGPLERPLGQGHHAVRLRDGAAGDAVAAREDEGLDGAVDLGQGHLECHLHRVEAELRVLPLLERLERGRNGAQVRPVEPLERGDCLGVVLGGWAAHEREAGQVDGHVHLRRAHQEEVLVDAFGEVERARVCGQHEAALRLNLHDHGNVVRVVLGVDVRLGQDEADDGRRRRVDADGGRVVVAEPPHVLDRVLKDSRCHRVPDALVRDHLGRRDDLARQRARLQHVLAGQVEQERLNVLG
eukprot:scaffold3665_cov102-Isochrysis_galbana.AAC.3